MLPQFFELMVVSFLLWFICCCCCLPVFALFKAPSFFDRILFDKNKPDLCNVYDLVSPSFIHSIWQLNLLRLSFSVLYQTFQSWIKLDDCVNDLHVPHFSILGKFITSSFPGCLSGDVWKSRWDHARPARQVVNSKDGDDNESEGFDDGNVKKIKKSRGK